MYMHIYIGGEVLARELMAITGLSAQELVRLARSAFGGAGATAGGTASATVTRERAAALSMFCNDGSTGDAMALTFIGDCLPFVEPYVANVMQWGRLDACVVWGVSMRV